MGPLVTIFVAIACFTLATLHVFWGLGHTWPARDPDALARMVVGTRESGSMPGMGPCLAVAGALFVAGLSPVFFHSPSPDLPDWVNTAGFVATLGAAAVFGLRGLFGFVEHRVRPEIEALPYARLNRRFYSPLCLVLAAAMFVAALG